MKACEAIQEDLPGYAGGRLSFVERGPVESHLRSCGACQAELASLERLERLLTAGLPLVDTSPTLRSRFANRLAAELEAEEAAAEKSGFGRFFRPWLIPALASAAVAVVVLAQTLGEAPPATEVAGAPRQVAPAVVAERPKAPADTTVAKHEPEESAPVQVADAGDPKEPSLGVPAEVESDPELFVDFDIIRELDALVDGSQESAG